MAITVTIARANVFDQNGIRLAVGSQQSLPDDFARALISQQAATDTNSVANVPAQRVVPLGIGSAAPNNSDGQPDGAVYIQTP